MEYFKNVKCLEDVKEIYRKLCLKLHPDRGGDMFSFIAMRKEYEKVFNKFKTIHRTVDGETKQEKYYEKDFKETPEEYADVIDKLVYYRHIKIELLGRWLWITGETKPIKDLLKSLGFKWSFKKNAWYKVYGYSNYTHSNMKYDDLKNYWGGGEELTKQESNIVLY